MKLIEGPTCVGEQGNSKLANGVSHPEPREADESNSGELAAVAAATAASRQDSNSPVHQMFEGQSVFITGASGFIGRVLLEKLLRTYTGIKTIYILMRTKKNQPPSDRLHKQLLKVPIFDPIRAMKNGQEILNKIVVIPGDIAEPNLGICDQHLNMMLADKSLSVVFHSAATIKFDEPLRTSIMLNLSATKTIIEMCKKLPNLVGLCHVSTAYVNSDIKDNTYIQERLYPFKDEPNQLINLANILDENLMQLLKAKLVDERPNTYTYTKAAAEHLVVAEASQLPVSIVRPSIVVAAWKEPLAGWVDNLNGPTGLILAIGKGLLRTMYCDTKIKADIVPVDIVVNSMIASVYYTAKINNKLPDQQSLQESSLVDRPLRLSANRKPNHKPEENHLLKNSNNNNNNNNINNNNNNILNLPGSRKVPLLKQAPVVHGDTKQSLEEEKTGCETTPNQGKFVEEQSNRLTHPIIHCNSGELNPLHWGDCENLFFPIVRKYPSCQVLRYPYGSFKTNKYYDYLVRIFVHFLPALLLDLVAGLLGRKPQLFSIYRKVHQATGALAHFCTQNYNYQTKNIKKLSEVLEHPLDREQLYLDIESVDWIDFWDNYILGARRFVLKEPDETLPEARKSFQRAHWIELGLRGLLLALVGAVALSLLAAYQPASVKQT